MMDVSDPDLLSERSASREAGEWTPPSVWEANALFHGYEVLSLLGCGGMGVVYQARQIELDRLVAIKLLPEQVSADTDFAQRFRREARAMARLNHPNVISIYELGTTRAGHLFFVMEFVEGANLHDVIQKVGLNQEQALSVAIQVCTALAYAHGKGIIHRDIKPENVLIDTESQVKVADFGLVRLMDPTSHALGHTVPGMVMGTPDYMAPEQTRGMNVDHRADIYSIGVMIYEMLCGRLPMGVFDLPSVKSKCDRRFDKIVAKAMHQSPERRYQSINEVKTDLQAVLKPEVVAAPAPAPVAVKPPGRLASLYTGLVVAALAMPTGAILARFANPKAPIPAFSPASQPAAPASLTAPKSEANFRLESASPAPAVAEKSTPAAPRQPLDLLALTDAVEDRVGLGVIGKANEWEKTNGVLRYKSDGKAGRIVAPVSIEASSYEVELHVVRLGGESPLAVDLPVGPGEIVSVTMLAPGTKFLDGEAGPQWPQNLPDGGRITLRYEAPTTEEAAHLVVQFEGQTIADVREDLRPRLKSADPHPAFPGRTLLALVSLHDSFEITSWKLRILEGKATALRDIGAAR
jgi:serine/threonine protein kinase